MFRGEIEGMQPYKPPLEGRSKVPLLLDFNERTTPPHPRVMENIREYLQSGRLQVYPEYGRLNEVVAGYARVDRDEVIVTNGSDQAIDIIYQAFVDKGDEVILPVPTFAMLEQSAHVQGAEVRSPRYRGPNLDFPFEEVIQEIKPGIKLVVICNPNNPTGTVVSRDQSEAIIEKSATVGAVVMIDEAYHEFNPELTVVDLVGRYNNLLITRSLSKIMGVSALRAGYVISQEQNIKELMKIRGPYDVNMLAVAAMMALEDPAVVEDMREYAREVMEVSKPILEEFYRQNGVRFYPSGAGFHLVEVGKEFYDFLDSKGIRVRPRSDPPGTVRISIGTKEDTQRYVQTFKEYLNRKTPI